MQIFEPQPWQFWFHWFDNFPLDILFFSLAVLRCISQIMYKFKVYDMMIWYTYILHTDYRSKSICKFIPHTVTICMCVENM